MGSAKIDITIKDIDGPNTKQLVDKFSFTYTEKGRRTAQFQEIVLNGTRAKPSRLRMSMGLQCQTYYYGDECSVFCIPSVDCKGHYSCDERTGDKICDQGWEGQDCTRPKVKEGSCNLDPCKNGGTCSVDKFSNTTDSDFFCCCPNGFTGSQCEIDINECDRNPCQSGGTCRNTPGSYICKCKTRYRGFDCEIPTTCTDNPCQHGKCVNASDGTFVCQCGSNFSGTFCESEITTSTPSTTTTTTKPTTKPTTTTTTTTTTESTTVPTTTKLTTPTTVTTETTLMSEETTEMTTPTTGVLASSLNPVKQSTISSLHSTPSTSKYLPPSVTPANGKVSYKCPINACKNNGKCLGGACHCPVGFSGQLCQTEEIECKSDSCLNGGYCNDNIGNFTCECPRGFIGSRCERLVEQSTVLPSTNACGFCGNGSCSVLENGTSVCMCRSGFSGKTCTYTTKMCRPYSAALCVKESECIVNSYRPNMDVCPSNWEGPLCRNESIPLSRDLECPRVVCKNDGHCYNGRCCCRSGYRGQFCEEEILRCDSSPCKNGATCINFFNSFECSCRVGFTGKLCEKPLFPIPISTTVPSETSTVTTRLSTEKQTTTTNLPSTTTRPPPPTTTTVTTQSVTTNIPTTMEIGTTEEERTTQPTTDSTVVSQSSPVTTEALQSTESVTKWTTGIFTEEATTESPRTTTDKTTSRTTETQSIDKTTSSDSLFARCRGYQCFLNRTCINTSYGRTDCQCMNVDKASSYIVNCMFVDFLPLTTVASSIGSSSSLQTTTTVGSSSRTTHEASTTIPVTTQTPSTKATTPNQPSPTTQTTLETTVVQTTPAPNTGNNSVTLGGKIPDKDIPAVKEAITNAVRNTSKGENCTDINILTTEYLYNKSRDVYTKVIYNSSDCPDASNLHKNPNLTGSLNNELAHSGSLGGHSVYTGKTSGLGKSYQVPLIGYVDNTVRTRIKEAIKKTWSNAGNRHVDVLIVDASNKVGQYGIYITEITYLVTSGLTFLQPRTENIPIRPSFYKQFHEEFPDERIQMYSGNTSYGYDSGLRFSIQQMKRSSALTVAAVYSKALKEWENIIKDKHLCQHQSCNTDLTMASLEITPTYQRSADVVLYPAINHILYTGLTISKALKARLSAFYNLCDNCNYPRLHYIDVEGRVKLKDEMNLKNKIKDILGTDDTNWRKSPFITLKKSIATRLYYLPKNPNDTKTTWPRPDMEGKLNLINSSLRSINRKLANQQIRKLHEVGLTGVTPKSEQHTVLDILGNAWASANKHVSREHFDAAIQAWNTNYVSSKGEPVTQVKYTLSILAADSSIAALSSPGANVLTEVMKSSHKTFCNCKAYQVRMLWTKDMKEFNSSVIQESVSKAWLASNDGFGLIIPTTVINSETGYVAGSGDNVRMYTYFIKPRTGTKEVEEEDLDEPTSLQIERELSKLVPGSRVFDTASRKSEPETEGAEWWVYLVIGIGCLALVIIFLTLLIMALRARSHRQSRTLKQDPKQMNGYDKEHFSKEPVMEKNSNGLYAVEDEDLDYSKTTYFVNNAYGESYQK
ncbi:uncharacterized protein LOC111119087 [Crassostrea virginica]